jgi:hypothetical protein
MPRLRTPAGGWLVFARESLAAPHLEGRQRYPPPYPVGYLWDRQDVLGLWAEIGQVSGTGWTAEALAALLRRLCRTDAERTANLQPGNAAAAGHIDQGSLGLVELVVSGLDLAQGVEHFLI